MKPKARRNTLTQNKFKDDLEIANALTKLLTENELSELEYQKMISKESSITIKIKKAVETPTAISQTQPNENNLPLPTAETEQTNDLIDSKADKENILCSPMVGTAYLSPDPNSDPFVKVGDLVKEGQPILIIEAMKTMNYIPSNKAGIIKNILVDNGSPVEFGDSLVVIE